MWLISKPLVSMKTHNVRAGELPETIAAQYRMSVAELNNLNGIGGRRRITTGQTLMVPNRDDLQPVLADGARHVVQQTGTVAAVHLDHRVGVGGEVVHHHPGRHRHGGCH